MGEHRADIAAGAPFFSMSDQRSFGTPKYSW